MVKGDFYKIMMSNPIDTPFDLYNMFSLMGYNIYTVIISILSISATIYLMGKVHPLMIVPVGIISSLTLYMIIEHTQKGNVEFENINKRGVE